MKNLFTCKWARGFCKRYRISNQRMTNNKAKSILEKIHLVSNYHQWLIYQFATEEPWLKMSIVKNEYPEISIDESCLERDEREGYESYPEDDPTSDEEESS